MKNNNDSFFAEALDCRQEARALTLEAICRLLIWMADAIFSPGIFLTVSEVNPNTSRSILIDRL
jgi:hypothetical protein